MGNESAKVGQQVLMVQPKSPAERAGLRPIFDFIVAANGVPLDHDGPELVDALKGNLDKEVRLSVYNTRESATRECVMVPTLTWGGCGCAGLSIRFAPFGNAHEITWHVTEVFPGSPAAEAGLCAGSDYIVGSPDVLFDDNEDFFLLVGSSVGRKTDLYVYSSLSDRVRIVSIIPRRWSGEGCLGCNVSSGVLHTVPAEAKPGDLSYSYPPPPQVSALAAQPAQAPVPVTQQEGQRAVPTPAAAPASVPVPAPVPAPVQAPAAEQEVPVIPAQQ